MNVLEASDLTKTFTRGKRDDSATTVLDGIDLTVAEGEFVAVMG